MEKEYGTIFLYMEKRGDWDVKRSLFRIPSKIRALIEKDKDWAHKSRHLTICDEEIGALVIFKNEGAYLNYTTLKSKRKGAPITEYQYADLVTRMNELERRGKREG